MRTIKSKFIAAVFAVITCLVPLPSYAGLFKLDFGQLENVKIPVDSDGNPTGPAPAALTNWDVIPTWKFTDFPGGNAVWNLTDYSADHSTNVTLTIIDDAAVDAALSFDMATGMTANNPGPIGVDVEYDGVVIPHLVKDDYLYRSPCPAGSEMLFRFGNLKPGMYNVTVFLGRTNDANGEFGKVWVDDINGMKEPATQNTGNFAGKNLDTGDALVLGQPQTVTVTVNAGDYLWFGYLEDSSGGISGMVIRSVLPSEVAPPPPSSTGLFKIDFGQLENERIPVDADGNPTGPAPAALTNWDVIGTWTFADFPDGVAKWKLTDFSPGKATNVSLTIADNMTLDNQMSFPTATGMTANNPTKEELDVVYDGVLVPHIVKDDYLYRAPCPAGSEMLFRFDNLAPGKYNVTVFMGRTTDNDGQFGKIWVDDINGLKEPAAQNTGDFGSKDLTNSVPIPRGQPQTVTVTLKAGDYLWFGYLEDSSGGISGMIIRGIADVSASVQLLASSTVKGPYVVAPEAQIDLAHKVIKVPASDAARFFRVQGSDKIIASSLANGVMQITYQ